MVESYKDYNKEGEKEPLISSRNYDQSIGPTTAASAHDAESINSSTMVLAPEKRVLVRETAWRWLMLSFGCFFLMGAYFCLDNPAPLKHTLQSQPFNMSNAQWSGLFSIYSFPNMILPLLGGIFIDKIGIRLGLILFTVVLTAGQLVFAIGGYQASYPMMMLGRFIFGLGGESMTVAQSAIVSSWFRGRELSFAFGVNLSVARIGSSINGPVVTSVAASQGVGMALLVGFFICCFSLIMAFLLVHIDRWAAKKDNVEAAVNEEEKFKMSDLKEFKGLPFWLVTASCVIVYMVIFPYIQFASDMLTERFGFGSFAGTLYALPYIISGVLSPMLGFAIDKFGRRALFIMFSSVLIFIACFVTTLIPVAHSPTDSQWLCLVPLILLGIGYSVYAAALWGCIPYTVPARLVGTAYGLCTAIQNIGLTISPAISAACLQNGKEHGYFWLMMYFCALSCIGIVFNAWLYIDDIRNRGSVLDSVCKVEEEPQPPLTSSERREDLFDDNLDSVEDGKEHSSKTK